MILAGLWYLVMMSAPPHREISIVGPYTHQTCLQLKQAFEQFQLAECQQEPKQKRRE